jgi:hypothetical protein
MPDSADDHGSASTSEDEAEKLRETEEFLRPTVMSASGHPASPEQSIHYDDAPMSPARTPSDDNHDQDQDQEQVQPTVPQQPTEEPLLVGLPKHLRNVVQQPRARAATGKQYPCPIDGCKAVVSDLRVHLKTGMHRELTDDRRKELAALKREMVKGDKRKARHAAKIGAAKDAKDAKDATDATDAPPPPPIRVRYLRRCVACPSHMSIDIWRHMKIVHPEWTKEQRTQALDACECVSTDGTSYDQALKKACPLEDKITKVFHEYCLLVNKKAKNADGIFTGDTKVTRDQVGNIRRILAGLAEEGKPLEWFDLKKFITLDNQDTGLFNKWQKERNLSAGSIANYVSSLRKFLTCSEDPAFKPRLHNPAWVVADNTNLPGMYTIRDYQLVINRLSLQYRKQGRAETTAKNITEAGLLSNECATFEDWNDFAVSTQWLDTAAAIAAIARGDSFLVGREDFANKRNMLMLCIVLTNFKRAGDLAHLKRAEYDAGHWVTVEEVKFWCLTIAEHKVSATKACPLCLTVSQKKVMDDWLAKCWGFTAGAKCAKDVKNQEHIFHTSTHIRAMSSQLVGKAVQDTWDKYCVQKGRGHPTMKLTTSLVRKMATTILREDAETTREEEIRMASALAHNVTTADTYYDKSGAGQKMAATSFRFSKVLQKTAAAKKLKAGVSIQAVTQPPPRNTASYTSHRVASSATGSSSTSSHQDMETEDQRLAFRLAAHINRRSSSSDADDNCIPPTPLADRMPVRRSIFKPQPATQSTSWAAPPSAPPSAQPSAQSSAQSSATPSAPADDQPPSHDDETMAFLDKIYYKFNSMGATKNFTVDQQLLMYQGLEAYFKSCVMTGVKTSIPNIRKLLKNGNPKYHVLLTLDLVALGNKARHRIKNLMQRVAEHRKEMAVKRSQPIVAVHPSDTASD